MRQEVDLFPQQIEHPSSDISRLLSKLNELKTTGVSLSEQKIRQIFCGTDEMIGVREIFQRNFSKSVDGFLNGELENAYALMMALTQEEMVPDYIKNEIEGFQRMVTK